LPKALTILVFYLDKFDEKEFEFKKFSLTNILIQILEKNNF